ncbi:MAG TPA: hypothetical protein VE308_03625, partial [Nitrososphaera sp.]|nr:hypothetical protein [Nitrososphaera sp.]
HEADGGIIALLKPYQTRPASHSTKKSQGFCIICGEMATTEALFKLEGAMIIQRYCEKCLPGARY